LRERWARRRTLDGARGSDATPAVDEIADWLDRHSVLCAESEPR